METKYLRMIKGMKRKGPKDWTVYLLRCRDESLYDGTIQAIGSKKLQEKKVGS